MQSDYTIYAAKTKAPNSCAVAAYLICAFVFVYAKSRFSHNATQIDFFFHGVNSSVLIQLSQETRTRGSTTSFHEHEIYLAQKW